MAEPELGPYLDDRKSFMDTVLRPLQDKKETLYVLAVSRTAHWIKANPTAARDFLGGPSRKVDRG